MDECIERGEFDEAVKMSEKLAQREVYNYGSIDPLQYDCNTTYLQFSSKVATAFECRDYIKRKKVKAQI